MSQHIFDFLAATRSLFLTNLTLIKQQIDSDNHATLILMQYQPKTCFLFRFLLVVFTNVTNKCSVLADGQ